MLILARTVSALTRVAPRTSMRDTVRSHGDRGARKHGHAGTRRHPSPADSATAETAVKNLEPAFMSSSYLFPMSRGKLVPTPVMLRFTPLLSLKQGHPFISVYFTKTA